MVYYSHHDKMLCYRKDDLHIPTLILFTPTSTTFRRLDSERT